MAAERLQKILARAGVASRRAAEQLIADGRVRVNGRIVTDLGTKATAHKDRIDVDGKRVVAEKPVYYVLHKPRGVVCTLQDPEGRPTIKDYVARVSERVFPVGRLDFNTSGTILLTNDGRFADALLKPRRHVPKTYAAKVQGHFDVPELDQLRNGVELDDGYVTKPAEVFVLREEEKATWLQITLTEGKNRQIHRMAQALGRRVLRLVRMSFAGINHDGLRPGAVRPLMKRELEKLEKRYLASKKTPGQMDPALAQIDEEFETPLFDFNFAADDAAPASRDRKPRGVKSRGPRANGRQAASEGGREEGREAGRRPGGRAPREGGRDARRSSGRDGAAQGARKGGRSSGPRRAKA